MKNTVRILDYRIASMEQVYSLEQLGEFYTRCFAAEYSQYLNDEDMLKVSSWSGRSLAEDLVAIDLPDTVTIASFNEDTLLGAATYAERQGTVFIWGMYVHPNRLREGIGILLINTIAKSVSGASTVEVSVLAQSEKAMRFYKKLGFQTYKTEDAEVFPELVLPVNYMSCKADLLMAQTDRKSL